MKKALLVLCLALPLAAAANTLYKCTDDSGVVLYTNQKAPKKSCIVLSHQSPVSAPSGNGARPRAAATPTPGDFPRVSGSEQKARDGDRRAILDKELATELQNAEKARKALAEAGNQPVDKLQPLRDTLALHERNVESLKKELGNLR
ncbi:DUF4124 domain-containing protein [Sulfuritalea hydrogenivorans]|uniref:DUF4124 domain-containing protein n=1 Tax=Sulfuritalea hydrogenivorans sk43H TaxID=1223802 RepID=W0SAI7_9PROT|nr:DUF4124 domain-containing protein [Sulfuritalea hydrogenivorans]MDK9713772.1 DUF4124 domain-containing protein [Sulfuritalea sp.]BAO27872.1 hypothetical protein SUTH_00052 [Sulfuritalea hydrogenivorans sk43H]